MLTRIEVKKTYWLGMSGEQKTDLLTGLVAMIEYEKECSASNKLFSCDELDALGDLRQALLNI